MRTSLQQSLDRGSLGLQFAPLSQRGGAVLYESGSSIEMRVVVEMVVDRGIGRSEFLQGHDIPEAGHGTLEKRQRHNGTARKFSARRL